MARPYAFTSGNSIAAQRETGLDHPDGGRTGMKRGERAKKSRRLLDGFGTSIVNDQATAIKPLSLLMAFVST
jgi:hypothetical protein